MNKTKIRIFIVLFALVITAAASVSVVSAEQEKKLNKYLAEKNYYTNLYDSWALYKGQYSKQVAQIKEENAKKMATAKENYDKLLLQQPGLIAQHTKTVQDGTAVQSGSQTIANVTSAAKTTQTVKVTKPKSQPKAKTS